MTKYHLDIEIVHYAWDAANEPRLAIAPGDVVEIECMEASGAQVAPGDTAEAIGALDFGRVNPLTGPIFVEGARPGDLLCVEILDFQEQGWGWTGVIPGFGLLADDFPEPYLKISELGGEKIEFLPGIEIPEEPFCGEMGVAPKEPGPKPTPVPDVFGGNLDTRGLKAGSILYLPVFHEGGLFCCGDAHAAQGDGEVCGTGIESDYLVTCRFDLVKDTAIAEPRFEVASPLTVADEEGYYCTTSLGPDLLKNAQNAVRYMIDHLGQEYGLDPYDAYALCSVAVDLKISQVVDGPNYGVSAYLPKSIFA